MKCKLGDIAEITMGQSPKSEYYNFNGEGVPFLQGNRTFGKRYVVFDTFTTMPTKMAHAGDIIMSVRAPVGDLNFTKKDMCLGRGVCSIRMNNGNQGYLYYLLKFNMQNLLKKESGTVFGSVNRTDIASLDLDIVDDYSLQVLIGRFLSMFDEKIEMNDKINQNLEQQVFSVYDNMFVKVANPQRTKCRADEFFDISIGMTPPRKEPQWFSNNPCDRVWVSISDMGNCGVFIGDSSEYITGGAVNKFHVKLVPDNTVILSFKLTVGRVAITDGVVTTNEAIAHFKINDTRITEYLYCYLKKFDYQTMGSTSSIATAVNSKIIKGMNFVIPTPEELDSFHGYSAPLFELIKNNMRENLRLSSLRDALLPKMMSGELDVSEFDF